MQLEPHGLFRDRFHLKSLVILQQSLQLVTLTRTLRSQTHRTDRRRRLSRQTQIPQIRPHLRLSRTARRLKIPHNLKKLTIHLQLLTDRQIFKSSRHTATGNRLKTTRLQITSLDNPKVRTQLATHILQTPNDQIHSTAIVPPRLGQNRHKFHRTHRTTCSVLRYPGQRRNLTRHLLLKTTANLVRRTLPQHNQIQFVPRHLQRITQSVRQTKTQDRCPDNEARAEHSHQCCHPADTQITNIVFRRNHHIPHQLSAICTHPHADRHLRRLAAVRQLPTSALLAPPEQSRSQIPEISPPTDHN